MSSIKLGTTLLVILVVLITCAEEKNNVLTIDAKLTNLPDSTLFYLKDKSNNIIDSAYVLQGSLSLSGLLKQGHPERLVLFTTGRANNEFIYTQLLVENEQISFAADKKDFPWNINVTGSKHQDQAEKFNQVEYQRQEIAKQLRLTYSDDKEILSKKLNEAYDSLDLAKVELIRQNPNSYAALNTFKYHKTHFSADQLKDLYNGLDPVLQETVTAKAIKLQSEYPKPEIGDSYYDFQAINQQGDKMSLSQIQDKYILLHFSSSACYGSQLSLPELKGLYQEFEDDLEIVSISVDFSKEQWQNTVKKDAIPWTYLWDGKGEFNEAYVKYWEIGTPNYVVISPEKVILDKWHGYREGLITEKLSKHLTNKDKL